MEAGIEMEILVNGEEDVQQQLLKRLQRKSLKRIKTLLILKKIKRYRFFLLCRFGFKFCTIFLKIIFVHKKKLN